MTTNLDVLYRYDRHPAEAAIAGLRKMRDVYGIRRIAVSEQEKTIRVEFDFTRLTRAAVAQLLRRAGIDVAGEISLSAPPPSPETSARRQPPSK